MVVSGIAGVMCRRVGGRSVPGGPGSDACSARKVKVSPDDEDDQEGAFY